MSDRCPLDWKGLDTLVLLEAGVEQRPGGMVVVPYRRPDGSVFRCKAFPPGGGSYWGPGQGLLPFGLERLRPPGDRDGHGVMVTEGESDCLAVRGALAAWRGGWLDVLGLPGATCWRSEWAGYLDGYTRAYVVPDGDDAGGRMLERIRLDVPGLRWVRVPEGEDARSVIQQRGVDAFCALLADADLAACRWVAFRLGLSPAAWAGHMQAMHQQGLWG